MAYASYNVSNAQEIVEAMVEFANDLAGWTASLSGSVATLTAPGKVRSFTATAAGSGLVTSITLGLTGGTTPTGYEPSVTIFQPVTSGLLQPGGGPPSRVEFFGRSDAEPFIVAAVECYPGSYKHLYVGYLEKLGVFDGGEIVAGCRDSNDIDLAHYYEDYTGYATPSLFEYPTPIGIRITNNCGGINLNGEWGRFLRNTSTQRFIEGGPRSRAMLAPLTAVNAFSGYSPFNPIQLFYGSQSQTDDYWIPIGTPAGVRAASLQNFAPGQLVTLPDGSEWRVYPCRRKGPNTTTGNVETSGIYGYAFLVND